MNNTFVETGNVKRFLGALSALEDRGAEEACLVVVDGVPGLGKTTTLKNWVAQTGSVYIRAQKDWSYSWFLNEILRQLNVTSPHRKEAKFTAVTQELAIRSHNARMARQTFGLVIDECDLISRSETIMEAIRSISDLLEIPTVMIGMGRLKDNLARFPQIASRVSQRVQFTPATLADAQALIKARCEVPVALDLTEFTLKVSQGYNREILEAIANIERFGLRFDCAESGVTMRDMAGQVIINDRRTNLPIVVPEVF